jgi:hypothetical protein
MIWRYRTPGSKASDYVVNAFAANDPISTLQALDRVRGILPHPSSRYAGILNLRADRGERTHQWLYAFRRGAMDGIGRMYLSGFHARALERRLRGLDIAKRLEVLGRGTPDEVMEGIRNRFGEGGGVVFGFGNMGGLGERMVDHWREVGKPLSLRVAEEVWENGI